MSVRSPRLRQQHRRSYIFRWQSCTRMPILDCDPDSRCFQPCANEVRYASSRCVCGIHQTLVYELTFSCRSHFWEIVRLTLTVLNALSIVAIRQATSRRYGLFTSFLFTILSCTQFYLPFWMGRTIPSMFALIPGELRSTGPRHVLFCTFIPAVLVFTDY